MVRGLWTSDALLLWEKVYGQKIKPGWLKKRREELQLLAEQEQLDEHEEEELAELDFPESKSTISFSLFISEYFFPSSCPGRCAPAPGGGGDGRRGGDGVGGGGDGLERGEV